MQSRMERLLICEWHHLGDAVNALPFVAAARTRFDVRVVCNPGTAEIFSWVLPPENILPLRAPWQGRRLGAPLAVARTAMRLRRFGCHAAVGAWADARVSIVQKLAGIPRRIGFPMTPENYFAWEASLSPNRAGLGRWLERLGRWAGPGPLLTEELVRADYHQPHHVSWRQLGHTLGLVLRDTARPPDTEPADSRTVLFHIAARLPHKRWQPEHWVDLGQRIGRQWRHRIEVVLAPGETSFPGFDAAEFDIVRTQTLTELRDRVRRARYVVCLDSLAGHVAAVHGIPVVALFGRMPACWFAPVGSEAWVVGGERRDQVYPCRDRLACLEPGYMLAEVTVEQVWARIVALEGWLANRVASTPGP